MSEPAPSPHQHPMHLLIRAERLLARRLRAALLAEGSTLDAWRVLTLLADGGGHFMSEIAEHASLPAPTLTKLVDQMVDDNLVYRRLDALDRRRIRVYLTPRGRRAYRRIHAAAQAAWNQLTTAGGDGRLSGLLAQLIDALETRPGTAPQAVRSGAPAHH